MLVQDCTATVGNPILAKITGTQMSGSDRQLSVTARSGPSASPRQIPACGRESLPCRLGRRRLRGPEEEPARLRACIDVDPEGTATFSRDVQSAGVSQDAS